MTDTKETTVWVLTEPTPDGEGYVVRLRADEHSRTLTPPDALDYARALLRAAHVAWHDAAVARQMKSMGLSFEDIAGTLEDLRKDRPPVEDCATDPLTFSPIVNKRFEPHLAIKVDGEQIGQWSFVQAEEHALHILGSVGVADLDAAYYRMLKDTVGLEERVARAAVGNLAEYRDGFR